MIATFELKAGEYKFLGFTENSHSEFIDVDPNLIDVKLSEKQAEKVRNALGGDGIYEAVAEFHQNLVRKLRVYLT